MSIEIERKFIVDLAAVPPASVGSAFVQAYVASGAAAVRVRISGDKARLTLKSSNAGLSRQEFEYDIPLADAQALAALPGTKTLTKTRHLVDVEGFTFEVDVYHGVLQGLVTAEVELSSESQEPPHPVWLGQEVTWDRRYSNEALATDGLPSP